LLESVKHACAGTQASVAVAFDASQREVQAAAGLRARQRGRGIAAQVALARREPVSRGSRHLGLAKALDAELPCTGEHLRHGRVSEWRATIVARETHACPPRTGRRSTPRSPRTCPPCRTGRSRPAARPSRCRSTSPRWSCGPRRRERTGGSG
jgi:hypothetical protein